MIDGAKAALKAGCDMVLICNAAEKADTLLAGLDVVPDALSSLRIAALVPTAIAADWDALQQDPRYQAARQTIQALAPV